MKIWSLLYTFLLFFFCISLSSDSFFLLYFYKNIKINFVCVCAVCMLCVAVKNPKKNEKKKQGERSNLVDLSVQLSTQVYIVLFFLATHQAYELGRNSIESNRPILNRHAWYKL